MKKILIVIVCLLQLNLIYAQNKTKNIIIVTTDGFRWQEVFGGMDKEIAGNRAFNENDEVGMLKRYWDNDVQKRREKLLPFIWTTISAKGQIYGNRYDSNKVNVSNPYWFSYPGYSEIFCGYADTAINSNDYTYNANSNVLHFLNAMPGYNNRVAAFGAWNAFERILNKPKSRFPITNAFDTFGLRHPTTNEMLLNKLLGDSYKPFGAGECLDAFTNYGAFEYLKNKHPKVLYISYGETDEWAHEGKYASYLNAAHQLDKWLNDLWNYIQSIPQYKNKTTLFVTVDHGRGRGTHWTSHGRSIEGSNEIWFAMIGPDTPPKGEITTNTQLYQNQFAATWAMLLGLDFVCEHPVGKPINNNIF